MLRKRNMTGSMRAKNKRKLSRIEAQNDVCSFCLNTLFREYNKRTPISLAVRVTVCTTGGTEA